MTGAQFETLVIGALAAVPVLLLLTGGQACRAWLRFLLPVAAACWVGLQIASG